MRFGDVHRFLKAVQAYDDRAIVAGGYLRDVILGGQPKDVDVWLYNPLPKDLKLELPGQYKIKRNIFMKDSLSIRRIISVEWEGIVFDIIQLLDPNIHAIDRFDFGINQVYYDGVKLITSRVFDYDRANHTISYINTPENYLRLGRIIKDRIPRMLAKYPDRSIRGLVEDNTLGTWVLPNYQLMKLKNQLVNKEQHTVLDNLCSEMLGVELIEPDERVEKVKKDGVPEQVHLPLYPQ